MDTNNRLAILITKHLDDELSYAEKRELEELLANSEKNRQLFEELTNPDKILKELKEIYSFDAKAGWNDLMKRNKLVGPKPRPVVKLIWYNVAAAAFIGFIVFVWYYWSGKDKNTPNKIAAPKINIDSIEYLHTGSSPLLLLDSVRDGFIMLDDFNNQVMWQGSVSVRKSGADTLKYYYTNQDTDPTAVKLKFALTTNIIVTPPGRRLHIILPEGTQVTMEPASTLSLVPDMRNKRQIHSISGEFLFDVAKKQRQRFHIQSYDIDLEVWGTRFSVVANRKTKTIRTNLHEGQILIRNRSDSFHLKPGQEAEVSSIGQIQLIAGNEEYRFDNDSFTAVMAKIEKWYDVQVEYGTQIPEGTFTAGINKNTPIEKLITMLEKKFHIHIKKKGRKLLVSL